MYMYTIQATHRLSVLSHTHAHARTNTHTHTHTQNSQFENYVKLSARGFNNNLLTTKHNTSKHKCDLDLHHRQLNISCDSPPHYGEHLSRVI
jgi:hypothetical protein